MADVVPFRALRPRDDLAASVIAPPYDVLSEEEARAIAVERNSFVRVTRSEVDLPAGTDAHSDVAYAKARENLVALEAAGVLVRDDVPRFYLYAQVWGEHRQVGWLAGASVAEYDADLIKKHELTRPDKEDDRTHHMEVLDAQVGLVFLAYREEPELAAISAEVVAGAPAWSVVTEDGVSHALYLVPDARTEAVRAAFGRVPALYVADGHHRSAAASRVHRARGSEASAHFLAGLFPAHALKVLAYNRIVRDLNGLGEAELLERVAASFEVTPTDAPVPTERGVITMGLPSGWYALTARPGVVDTSDPVARLDVSVLQDRVLEPLLGITDPRRSSRIEFIGGIRGVAALQAALDSGRAAVAFHLFPTGLDQLFDVADAGMLMPPKSTWFEPKLREGVVVRPLV
jgi:uncharacterized protein (DUF1015 family)